MKESFNKNKRERWAWGNISARSDKISIIYNNGIYKCHNLHTKCGGYKNVVL